jgi:hypothetical protein
MDVSPADKDNIVRTVLGEAEDQSLLGQAAVAHVILNRLAAGKYGETPSKIVHAPGQFEAWKRRRGEIEAYNPRSLKYQNTDSIVDDVLSGAIPDPTGGATHYFAPVAQKDLGRQPPAFSRTPMTAQIGAHNFYAPEGRVIPEQDDLLGSWHAGGAAPVVPPDDLLGHWNTGKAAPAAVPLPAARPSTAAAVAKKKEDETLPQWTARMVAEHQGSDWTDLGARFGAGAVRGIGDVADTLATAITSVGERGAKLAASAGVISPETAGKVSKWAGKTQAEIVADRQAYEKAAEGSALAEGGRITGQILGTGPFVEALPLRGIAAASPMARAAVTGIGSGGTAAALTSSASDQPLSQQIGAGMLAGGALGPLTQGASAATKGLRNLVFGSVDKETAQLASAARNTYNIPITAGQISTSPSVRFLDSVLQRLPFSGYAKRTTAQQVGLNRALASEMGVDAGKITPDTITRASRNAYTEYNAAKARMGGNLALDHGFYGDLQNIHQNAHYVLEPSLAEGVDKLLRNVLSKVDLNSHTLDADLYQSLTREKGPLDNAINSRDSKIASYAGDIKNSLEELVGRNDPILKKLKDTADYRWFVIKSVEPLALKSPTGDVSPGELLRALDNSQTNAGELGRIAKRFMREPPSSGTAERLMLMKAGVGLGSALGLGGAYALDPEGFQRDAAIAAATLGAGRGASAILRSNALTNSMIRGGLGTSGGTKPLSDLLTRAAPAAALVTRRRLENSPASQ